MKFKYFIFIVGLFLGYLLTTNIVILNNDGTVCGVVK